MNYIQHSLVGLGTAGLGIWVGHQLGLNLPDPTTTVIATALIVAGSISPDIDHPNAYISRYLPLRILKKLAPPLILVVGLVVGLSIVNGYSVRNGLYSFWSDFPPARWALAAIGFALGLMLVARLVSTAVKHRGPLHSATFSFGVALVAIGVTIWANQDWRFWWLGACFGWGWVFHVLADGLTCHGVPLWWPFTNKRIRFFGWLRF